jgi:hypothetical protein
VADRLGRLASRPRLAPLRIKGHVLPRSRSRRAVIRQARSIGSQKEPKVAARRQETLAGQRKGLAAISFGVTGPLKVVIFGH